MDARHSGIQMPTPGSGRLSGQELSAVCQRILQAETQDGLTQGRDYQINLQKFSSASAAFRRQDDGLYESKVTPLSHGRSKQAFEGLVAQNPSEFKAQLYQMWFRLYTREVRDDTCGFEHVFVGESKKGEISGLHNWLQFFYLEQHRELDYRGYIFPKRIGGNDHSDVSPHDLIISVQFNVAGQVKEVSSIWLGTSPAFELALYTLCFVGGLEKNIFQLENQSGRYEVEVRCYRIRSKYGDKIGSAFPVLLAKHPGQIGAAAPTQEYAPQLQQNYPPQHQQTYNSQDQSYAPPQQQQYPVQPQQNQPMPNTQQQGQQEGFLGCLVLLFKCCFGKSGG